MYSEKHNIVVLYESELFRLCSDERNIFDSVIIILKNRMFRECASYILHLKLKYIL